VQATVEGVKATAACGYNGLVLWMDYELVPGCIVSGSPLGQRPHHARQAVRHLDLVECGPGDATANVAFNFNSSTGDVVIELE
jgi:hypothetical protein